MNMAHLCGTTEVVPSELLLGDLVEVTVHRHHYCGVVVPVGQPGHLVESALRGLVL